MEQKGWQSSHRESWGLRAPVRPMPLTRHRSRSPGSIFPSQERALPVLPFAHVTLARHVKAIQQARQRAVPGFSAALRPKPNASTNSPSLARRSTSPISATFPFFGPRIHPRHLLVLLHVLPAIRCSHKADRRSLCHGKNWPAPAAISVSLGKQHGRTFVIACPGRVHCQVA